jgi:hypothetical protein
MFRICALLLGLLGVAVAVILLGLLTNWFRYALSLEATVVVAVTVLAVFIVGGVSYLSYMRNSAAFLGLDAVVVAASIAVVLLIHREALGGLPRFYVAHKEKSPPAVLQTTQGSFKYWIEIANPFSARHAEFLVFGNGSAKRIPIQVFAGPATAYMSATKVDDWGTLSSISDPNVAILTLGPRLSPSGGKFRIDIESGTAGRLRGN